MRPSRLAASIFFKTETWRRRRVGTRCAWQPHAGTMRAHATQTYFFSPPAGVLPPPTLSISGSVFFGEDGASPVVTGSGAWASGRVAAGGRSGVPVLGLLAAGGAAVGFAASGKSRVGACADATPELARSTATANTGNRFVMVGTSRMGNGRERAAHRPVSGRPQAHPYLGEAEH